MLFSSVKIDKFVKISFCLFLKRQVMNTKVFAVLMLLFLSICPLITNGQKNSEHVNRHSKRGRSDENEIRTTPKLIESSLWDYVYNSRIEKCYLHLDKESCIPGDTLFFRGYIFNGSSNQIVDYSRFIYVELVDRSGVVYTREKISCDTSLTFYGYLPISENVSQGEFFVRAYTYWMQNESEEYLFRKRIRIVSPYDHKIRCEMDVEYSSGGRRILKLEFLNREGERYQNVEFHYKIPGETPDTTYVTVNTGYNGQQRIVVEDSLSDHIWISFSHNCEWDYEAYLPIPGSRRDYNVTFYPEGGTYIAGTPLRVGVKSVGRDGIGVPVSGSVYDDSGAYITSFSTNKMGVGSFEIVGSSLVDYVVKVQSSSLLRKEYSLPHFSTSGVSLRVDANDDKVIYKLLCDSSNSIRNSGYVVIHSRGIPLAVLDIPKSVGRTMDLSGAPSGLIHFVLTDSLGNVQSERLWFHIPKKSYSMSVTLPSGVAECRSMQSVAINFSNNLNPNDTLLFSVSVINNGQTLYDNRNGGLPLYLLLDSDLSGFVENPAYYFASSTINREKELDNLMLTHKWSRFDVAQILKDEKLVNSDYYVERGQFLSGVVKNYMGKPVVNADILIVGSNGLVRESVTDSAGRFIENDIWYDEDTRFYVQALRKGGRDNVEMSLDNPLFRNFNCVEPVGLYLYCNDNEFYKTYGKDYIFADNGERIQTLGIVKVGAMSREKQQEQLLNEWQQNDMRTAFSKGFTGVKTYGQLWWSDAMMGHAAGFRAYEKLKDWLIYGKNPGGDLEILSAYWYDGNITDIPGVSDEYIRRWKAIERNTKSQLDEAPSTLIYKGNYDGISVLNGGYDRISGRVIPFFEKNPIIIDYQYNIQTVVPFAPQISAVNFILPSYERLTELQKKKEDEKITRYWNPDCILRSGDTFHISFPTAAGYANTSYTVIIEGITTSGIPIYETKIIEI